MKHLALILILVYGSVMFAERTQTPKRHKDGSEVSLTRFRWDNKPLTITNVRHKLNKTVKFPEIVMSQILLETGRLESYSATHRNNLIGLSWKGEIQSFDHWSESIDEYVNQIEHKFKGETEADYYQFLRELPYATDPEYIEKLKSL